jgi:hypothetical protein
MQINYEDNCRQGCLFEEVFICRLSKLKIAQKYGHCNLSTQAAVSSLYNCTGQVVTICTYCYNLPCLLQGCGSAFISSGSGSSILSGSGSRALMTKNWKKITDEKKIYLSLGLHKERPSY